MKYCTKYSWLIFLFILNRAFAQDGFQNVNHLDENKEATALSFAGIDTANIRPLKIGERVPDILFQQMINYPLPTAKLSDFKGKVVVLDFWSTSCVVCIAQFPKIHKLQQEVKEKAAIIPVGFEGNKNGSIQEFIAKKRNTAYALNLPTAVQTSEDNLLEKLFPFSGMPHEVWINPNGILVGITDHKAVTNYNIERVFNGEYLTHSSKIPNRYFRSKNEFLIPKDSITGKYKFWGSLFYEYTPGLLNGTQFGKQFDSSIIRLYDVNQNVIEYYLNAYQFENKWLNKKMIRILPSASHLKSWDSAVSLDDRAYQKFCKENNFSYELILPSSNYTLATAYRHMISDLDRYLGVKSKISVEKNTYLALVRISQTDKLKSSEIGQSYVEVKDDMNDSLHIVGESINALISQLNLSAKTTFIIRNETNYPNLIDIVVPYGNNIPVDRIRTVLQKYGLDLVQKVKKEAMLILQ